MLSHSPRLAQPPSQDPRPLGSRRIPAQSRYSDAARKKRIEGTVVLAVIVDERGTPTNLYIVRGIGSGLDEQAIAAVRQWTFRPGRFEGNPVKVAATIEVMFRLPPETTEAAKAKRGVRQVTMTLTAGQRQGHPITVKAGNLLYATIDRLDLSVSWGLTDSTGSEVILERINGGELESPPSRVMKWRWHILTPNSYLPRVDFQRILS